LRASRPGATRAASWVAPLAQRHHVQTAFVQSPLACGHLCIRLEIDF